MSKSPRCYAIIPARYHSSRFPGKPLVDILGKPMFQWVYERARSCRSLDRVWLATDDRRIFTAAEQRGVPVVMTAADHPSGSDRIMEAAEKLELEDEAVVVNIQGDEPALDPEMVAGLVEPFTRPEVEVTTLARIIDSEQAANPDRVKVVRAINGEALYFSRAKIPHVRDPKQKATDCLLHIGLYAYRLPILRRFTSLPPSPLEKLEKLEQLRLLEAGIKVHVVLSNYTGFGVDRPDDVALIAAQMKGL